MLGGELTKLKEQLKEVNNGADSVIENSEKLKNNICKKIREIKVHIVSLCNASLFIHFLMLVTVFSLCLFFYVQSQKAQKISSKSKSISSSPNRVAKVSVYVRVCVCVCVCACVCECVCDCVCFILTNNYDRSLLFSLAQ